MAEKAEHALIECLKQKSAEAFEELVARYGRRLYPVSLRILRNPEDAEDAVQDSFLSVYRNIDRFREESSLYTWLYRIACNQALAKRREQGRAYVAPTEPYLARFPEGQHLDEILAWSHMPDVLLSTQEIQGFFEKCIDELPEEFRMAYIHTQRRRKVDGGRGLRNPGNHEVRHEKPRSQGPPGAAQARRRLLLW